MASERRIALDTCVLLNFLTDGAGDDPAWLGASQRVLRHGYTGDFRLVISAVVITELAGAGSVRGTHIPKVERVRRIKRVRAWLADHGPWLLVELDERLARQAADLAIEHQLKGGDAVILASAVAAKAETLVTWDSDLLKLNGVIDFEICTPRDLEIEQEDFDDLADG